MKVKVSETSGTLLDWLVAIALGWTEVKITGYCDRDMPEELFFRLAKVVNGVVVCQVSERWHPSTNPSQAYPIIKLEKISTIYLEATQHWIARSFLPDQEHAASTSDIHDPLVAAMRCYVVKHKGDVVEVPDEVYEALKA